MPQIVVDTDVLILHLRGSESVRAILRAAAQDSLLSCSAITIGEIYAGLREEEREKTERLLNSLAVIAVDRNSAALAGDARRHDQEPAVGTGRLYDRRHLRGPPGHPDHR